MQLHEELLIGLTDYRAYAMEHALPELLGVDISSVPRVDDSAAYRVKPANYSPGDSALTPYPPQLDDIIRLHYLIVSRKVTTVLEFGLGHSTVAIDNALRSNEERYGTLFTKNLRGSNWFECHSVDDDDHWFHRFFEERSLGTVHGHFSETIVDLFNGRVCTFYKNLPNISPDFIYLDGPDQYSVTGDVRGISTNHPDRMPMAADILSFEHFLYPGTLIVVDGRAANARFLKSNFQRNWAYSYFEEADQHFFELQEPPLGPFNKARLEHCLGESYFRRLDSRPIDR